MSFARRGESVRRRDPHSVSAPMVLSGAIWFLVRRDRFLFAAPCLSSGANCVLGGGVIRLADAPTLSAAPRPRSMDHRSPHDDAMTLPTDHSTLRTVASCFSDGRGDIFSARPAIARTSGGDRCRRIRRKEEGHSANAKRRTTAARRTPSRPRRVHRAPRALRRHGWRTKDARSPRRARGRRRSSARTSGTLDRRPTGGDRTVPALAQSSATQRNSS